MQQQNKRKQNEVITLFDDIFDEDNPFNNIKTDDIYIEDNLFDNKDSQDIKEYFKWRNRSKRFKWQHWNTLWHRASNWCTKKLNIITHPNRTRIESRRILNKYWKQWQKGNLKKSNKKASKWLKKADYLGTDDLQTIDYNNDTPIDDLETVDFNNDTEMSDLIDLKETSGTKEVEFIKQVPLHPRERLKRKTKAELNDHSKLSKKKVKTILLL